MQPAGGSSHRRGVPPPVRGRYNVEGCHDRRWLLRRPITSRHSNHLATLTYLPLTTLRMALAPAPSRTSSIVISPATPGKFLSPLRHSRILSRSESRSAGLLEMPAFSKQYLYE